MRKKREIKSNNDPRKPDHRRPSRKGADSPELAAAKARVLECLVKCHGVKSAACDMAGITRQTLYNWEQADPSFSEHIAALALMERKKDFVEYSLLKLVAKGQPAAVIFANKCINQDRGYVEKKEVELTTTAPFILLTSPPAAPPEPGIPS